jgi:hypothetical protein
MRNISKLDFSAGMANISNKKALILHAYILALPMLRMMAGAGIVYAPSPEHLFDLYTEEQAVKLLTILNDAFIKSIGKKMVILETDETRTALEGLICFASLSQVEFERYVLSMARSSYSSKGKTAVGGGGGDFFEELFKSNHGYPQRGGASGPVAAASTTTLVASLSTMPTAALPATTHVDARRLLATTANSALASQDQVVSAVLAAMERNNREQAAMAEFVSRFDVPGKIVKLLNDDKNLERYMQTFLEKVRHTFEKGPNSLLHIEGDKYITIHNLLKYAEGTNIAERTGILESFKVLKSNTINDGKRPEMTTLNLAGAGLGVALAGISVNYFREDSAQGGIKIKPHAGDGKYTVITRDGKEVRLEPGRVIVRKDPMAKPHESRGVLPGIAAGPGAKKDKPAHKAKVPPPAYAKGSVTEYSREELQGRGYVNSGILYDASYNPEDETPEEKALREEYAPFKKIIDNKIKALEGKKDKTPADLERLETLKRQSKDMEHPVPPSHVEFPGIRGKNGEGDAPGRLLLEFNEVQIKTDQCPIGTAYSDAVPFDAFTCVPMAHPDGLTGLTYNPDNGMWIRSSQFALPGGEMVDCKTSSAYMSSSSLSAATAIGLGVGRLFGVTRGLMVGAVTLLVTAPAVGPCVQVGATAAAQTGLGMAVAASGVAGIAGAGIMLYKQWAERKERQRRDKIRSKASILLRSIQDEKIREQLHEMFISNIREKIKRTDPSTFAEVYETIIHNMSKDTMLKYFHKYYTNATQRTNTPEFYKTVDDFIEEIMPDIIKGFFTRQGHDLRKSFKEGHRNWQQAFNTHFRGTPISELPAQLVLHKVIRNIKTNEEDIATLKDLLSLYPGWEKVSKKRDETNSFEHMDVLLSTVQKMRAEEQGISSYAGITTGIAAGVLGALQNASVTAGMVDERTVGTEIVPAGRTASRAAPATSPPPAVEGAFNAGGGGTRRVSRIRRKIHRRKTQRRRH